VMLQFAIYLEAKVIRGRKIRLVAQSNRSDQARVFIISEKESEL